MELFLSKSTQSSIQVSQRLKEDKIVQITVNKLQKRSVQPYSAFSMVRKRLGKVQIIRECYFVL